MEGRRNPMKRVVHFRLAMLLALLGGAVLMTGLRATESPDEPVKNDPGKVASPMPTWATTAVKPKPLSEVVDKGLAYLISQQNENGGWGQGGGRGSRNGRRTPERANVQ